MIFCFLITFFYSIMQSSKRSPKLENLQVDRPTKKNEVSNYSKIRNKTRDAHFYHFFATMY